MHIASPLGCRFSKSPQERERILAKRKDDLIKQARRYVYSFINLKLLTCHLMFVIFFQRPSKTIASIKKLSYIISFDLYK